MTMRRPNGWRRRKSAFAGCAAIALAVTMGAALPAAAQDVPVQRLVIAVDPPAGDTNLFWATSADVTMFPALPRLVGNDPVTGEYNDDGLAESWEASEDFSEWTFKLHEGVPWHFGYGEVTAHDVVHSYDLNVHDQSVQSGVGQLKGAKVEALDDHTVKFTFDGPRVGFLFSVASRGSMLIYSKAQFDAEGIEGYQRRPAGTGHYRYVERLPGEKLVFERVENHWSGEDAAFPELEFRWAPEPATKLALLLSGEAHISDLPRELQGDAVAQGMKVIGSLNPSMQVTGMLDGLYLKSGDPAARPDLPWADIRVREAMNRALNREELIEILYDGRADRLVRYGMDPRHEGYVPELEERFDEMYGYDPERAKELLAEAGYPDAFPDPVIPIISSVLQGNPEFGTMAELFQVYFEEIGLQTEIREMDWASLGALGRGRESYTVHPIRNAPIRPTEVHLINSYTAEGSQFHGFENDEIQAMIDELVATVDPEERDRIAAEAFTYLFEQYSDMPIAALRAEMTVNPEVVADWPFPGVTTAGMSHWHLIEPAR
ncbi:MAG TPA: ABC transporter substrate-binding protein [Gemmatimonadales bacterium]|nr:ABC transporter substrate-binding protein [Gemmatimonadales bacterium]